MQASLRQVLRDSHVAAATIAVLLASSLGAAILALWGFANRVLYFLVLASEQTGMSPFAHLNLAFETRQILSAELANLPVSLSLLVSALACLLAARLLSRWTYGVGPLRALAGYRNKLSRKTHA